ncbi:MAG TPA: efflux RND transporter periplasmic adaptor subunit [Burkholderiales bacterium]|nr:efflux RND transporter periplasmic adaptor subunit [Burkholderiales bacterium]
MAADENSPLIRSPWLKRGLLIALALAAAGFALRNVILGAPVETVRAVRSDLAQTVVASGRIMTPQRVSVGAVITGRVARIPVQEGQSVRSGDVLMELDDSDERAAVEQSRAAVAQAEAKLRQLRELALPAAEQGLVQAQANLTQSRRQYDRAVELKAKGFVSQAALDDAQRNLDVAESQLRSAKLQVQSNSRAGSEFAVAETTLAQARAGLHVAQAKLDETIIRAPVGGILIARAVEPGNVVQPGKELMALAPSGETQVVVQIDEKNLAQLRVGQNALGSADAYPRERFAAELVYINPGIDALRGAVEVKLRVPNPPGYLRQDMTVSVDIEVARSAGAVVVPADAVRDANGAQPWVLAVDGGRATRRAVKLGLKGDGRMEVLEGVAPGDLLVSAAQQAVKAGQRVRAIAPVRP